MLLKVDLKHLQCFHHHVLLMNFSHEFHKLSCIDHDLPFQADPFIILMLFQLFIRLYQADHIFDIHLLIFSNNVHNSFLLIFLNSTLLLIKIHLLTHGHHPDLRFLPAFLYRIHNWLGLIFHLLLIFLDFYIFQVI